MSGNKKMLSSFGILHIWVPQAPSHSLSPTKQVLSGERRAPWDQEILGETNVIEHPAPVLENDMHKLLWDFDIQTDQLIPARRPDRIIINNNKKKKRICKIVDFAVPADHRINLKENEKKDKYLDLARELKKLWNMKVTIVPIVIGALGTITKGLLNGLEDLEVGARVETIQTTALLRTARILRRVRET